MHKPYSMLITCEHGGNQVPLPFQRYVDRSTEKALRSHRGYDIGALPVAKLTSNYFNAPLMAAEISRLLVDLNRSPHHRSIVAPEFKKKLDRATCQQILQRYYYPYREKIAAKVSELIDKNQYAVHIAVHSFTPKLGGVTRLAEIGLLYDPARSWESELCKIWQSHLLRSLPEMRIRRNYPYRGVADGLTKHLRTLYRNEQYVGIELEINNKLLKDSTSCRTTANGILTALEHSLKALARA